MFFVQIAGRLGKDPETRFTAGGQKVTAFSVAVNQRKGKEDVTTWIRVTIWGDRFDKILPYLKKGSGVIICGKMSPPSTYTDKEGRTQTTLEMGAEAIEFNPFGGKGDSADQQGNQGGNQGYQNSSTTNGFTPYQQNYSSSHNGDASENSPQPSYQKPQSMQQGQGQHDFSSSIDDDILPF